jgi:hypothetical protein
LHKTGDLSEIEQIMELDQSELNKKQKPGRLEPAFLSQAAVGLFARDSMTDANISGKAIG